METYQKKTQLEHILLRPETYIGSVKPSEELTWVIEEGNMCQKKINFVPGLYKIFDEILVNAVDNKQRDPTTSTIKVNIDSDKNEITIWNNGRGIPITKHESEGLFIPELIFGTLLTSSNYDDTVKKVTGGRNGFGAKLCNIFSNKFSIETTNKDLGLTFKQTWTNNMSEKTAPQILKSKVNDHTKVVFVPDLTRFNVDTLEHHLPLFKRRVYDLGGICGVNVYFNGEKVPIKNFSQYINIYPSTSESKLVYEKVNERWEVGVKSSSEGYQQVSFVNGIATTRGGRHVEYVCEQIVGRISQIVKKKLKTSALTIKPQQIKNHLHIFVNCLIENPTFDSQTKETLTTQVKDFGSVATLSEKFLQALQKCGIVEAVLSWSKVKEQSILDKKCSGKKTTTIHGIPKLEDANDAGTKHSMNCTLILTEGDSAKTLAVAGLSVVGRDRWGVFPLKGKCLNVREASSKQIMENEEINNIIKILGLQYKRSYATDEDMKTLRYGKVLIMTDQDPDGSHIKGLIINFIHTNWPSLIQRPFIEEFITPLIKVKKGPLSHTFYSLPEYRSWKEKTVGWEKYVVKYYKGLGTSTSAEGKDYFREMKRHRIPFFYEDEKDDEAIELAFSKKKIEERKTWLSAWMKNKPSEGGLYAEQKDAITYSEFINKELVLFSNMDNERSIPNVVDGLKPGQRKVLFTCFKRNDKKEIKVAQLAGSVAEKSAYHHGEESLMSTIINLAQDYVGSNNINLLQPLGQFGTRLEGGKDHASPRYIFTKLNPLTRLIFPEVDDAVLRYLEDDNQPIEPEWFCPIVPMVLINGASGIGTGWATKIPNYNPTDVIKNIRHLILDEPVEEMTPWYKDFKGSITQSTNDFLVKGIVEASVAGNSYTISELPLKVCNQSYKKKVLEPMLEKGLALDIKDHSTDKDVRIVVKLAKEQNNVEKFFKLESTLSLRSMVLFDAENVLHRYESVEDIMREFFEVRKKKFIERKKHLESLLEAHVLKLSNQARFIVEKIQGDVVIENRKKDDIVKQLVDRKFDPVQNSFDYLIQMQIIKLSEEEKDKLLKEEAKKLQELEALRVCTWQQMWLDELFKLEDKLSK